MHPSQGQASPARAGGSALPVDATARGLMARTVELLELALSQHIYDASNGEAPGEDCVFSAHLAEVKAFLARPTAHHEGLEEGLRLIATQSIGPDWSHEQAFDFMRATARSCLGPSAESPETPADLAAAGYRIERGGPNDGDLLGKFWWTWCKGGAGVDASNQEWPTADDAIADARSVEHQLRSGRRA